VMATGLTVYMEESTDLHFGEKSCFPHEADSALLEVFLLSALHGLNAFNLYHFIYKFSHLVHLIHKGKSFKRVLCLTQLRHIKSSITSTVLP
jgi:hypothetical protein